MAGRFTMRRVAAPEIVPAAEESVLEQVSWTVLPEAAAEPARRRARRQQSAAHRQAP